MVWGIGFRQTCSKRRLCTRPEGMRSNPSQCARVDFASGFKRMPLSCRVCTNHALVQACMAEDNIPSQARYFPQARAVHATNCYSGLCGCAMACNLVVHGFVQRLQSCREHRSIEELFSAELVVSQSAGSDVQMGSLAFLLPTRYFWTERQGNVE